MLRSPSPTTPAACTPAATAWRRWSAGCSATSPICDPRDQSIARAGRGAAGQPQRDRRRGQRAGDARPDPPLAGGRRADGPRPHRPHRTPRRWASTSPSTSEQGDLAREGLALLADAPAGAQGRAARVGRVRRLPGRRGCPQLEQDWKAHRDGAARRGRAPRRPIPSLKARKLDDDQPAGAGDHRPRRRASPSATHVVLDGVDLTVAEGTVFALLGPERRRQDHDGAHPVHPDPGRRRRDPGRRARPRHRPGRGAGPIGVTGQFSAVDNLLTGAGEPAADGRPAPPRPRSRAGAGSPSCSSGST